MSRRFDAPSRLPNRWIVGNYRFIGNFGRTISGYWSSYARVRGIRSRLIAVLNMPKRKSLPPLTPRAVQIVNLVVNSVALGTHDNDAEIGVIARQLGMAPKRLQ